VADSPILNYEEAVRIEIPKQYPGAMEIVVSEIGVTTPEGKALYADFKKPNAVNNKMVKDFCYAMVLANGTVKLMDDGEELVRYFQTILDRKRSLWSRFNELNFNDMIGAFIAFTVVGTFAFLVIYAAAGGRPSGDWVSKEFLAIVSVVLGFYFGRNPKAKE
jgi:hypothetical protein